MESRAWDCTLGNLSRAEKRLKENWGSLHRIDIVERVFRLNDIVRHAGIASFSESECNCNNRGYPKQASRRFSGDVIVIRSQINRRSIRLERPGRDSTQPDNDLHSFFFFWQINFCSRNISEGTGWKNVWRFLVTACCHVAKAGRYNGVIFHADKITRSAGGTGVRWFLATRWRSTISPFSDAQSNALFWLTRDLQKQYRRNLINILVLLVF